MVTIAFIGAGSGLPVQRAAQNHPNHSFAELTVEAARRGDLRPVFHGDLQPSELRHQLTAHLP